MLLHGTTTRAAIAAAGTSGATATAKQGGAPCYLSASEERSGEREVQELDQGGFVGSECEHAEHRQQPEGEG